MAASAGVGLGCELAAAGAGASQAGGGDEELAWSRSGRWEAAASSGHHRRTTSFRAPALAAGCRPSAASIVALRRAARSALRPRGGKAAARRRRPVRAGRVGARRAREELPGRAVPRAAPAPPCPPGGLGRLAGDDRLREGPLALDLADQDGLGAHAAGSGSRSPASARVPCLGPCRRTVGATSPLPSSRPHSRAAAQRGRRRRRRAGRASPRC